MVVLPESIVDSTSQHQSDDIELEKCGYQSELKRDLGLTSVLLYGMAMLFPVAPATGFGPISTISHGHMVLAYILASIPMAFTAWSYGQMSGAFPVTGSSYTYISRVLTPHVGFIAGWTLLLDYCLFPVLNYICIAFYVQALFPEFPYWWIIIASIVLVTTINLMGIKDIAGINNVLTIFGFLVIGYFIVMAINVLSKGTGTGFSTLAVYNPQTFDWSTVLLGASAACYSFIGFDTMTNLSEEVKNPAKMMPRATLIVCISMATLFSFAAYLAQSIYPDYTQFVEVNTAFVEVAKIAGGHALETMICLATISCGLAFAIDAQVGVSRLLYGMGRDNVIPKKFFTYVHPKTKVPVYSSIIMALFCLSLSWMDLVAIIPMINFGALAAYALVNLCVIVHFYIRGHHRSFVGFLMYLLLPGLGCVTCLVLLFSLSTTAQIIGCTWFSVGLLYMTIKTNFFRKPITLHM